MIEKKLLSITLLGFLLLFGIQIKAQKQSDMNNARAIAVSELQKTLEQMPVGQEALYGFNSRAEFAKATVGMVLCESIGHDGNAEFNRYRFVVSVNGEARALVDYQREGSSWIMSGFGATKLANEIAKMKATQDSEVHSAQLVRINDKNFKGDFIKFHSSFYEGMDTKGFMPMNCSKVFYSQKNSSTMSPSYSIDEMLKIGSNQK